MLATVGQRTCRALPRLLPRCSRPLTTEADAARDEARDALFGAGEGVSGVATVPQPPVLVDLDQMHHHVPPAQAPLLQFFTTMIMRHGKYALASRTTSNMLLHIHAMTRTPPVPLVEQAILKASPAVRARKMKKGGGKIVHVPQALSERQRTRLGIKWIVDRADTKGFPGKTLAERLARQVVATIKGDKAIQDLKDDMHKLAMVNRCVSRAYIQIPLSYSSFAI